MKPLAPFTFPPDRQKLIDRAMRIQWITLFYMLTVVVVMYLVSGSSQAMKTVWLDDLLSLVAPIGYLISTPIARRKPTDRFPFGYQRAKSIAFMAGALALLALGGFLLIEAVHKLLVGDHPTIGVVAPLGKDIWLGWPMLLALVYTGTPTFFLGRIKTPLARSLHDQVLHVDAEMNRADWITAVGAAIGVLGAGFGYWWLDSGVAALISIDITRDGLKSVGQAARAMLDERPRSVDDDADDPLPERLRTHLRNLPWVADADVRLRDAGHGFHGQAFVVPRDARNLLANVREAARTSYALDWKMWELSVMPVESLDEGLAPGADGESAGPKG